MEERKLLQQQVEENRKNQTEKVENIDNLNKQIDRVVDKKKKI
jgi:hypothetical protein